MRIGFFSGMLGGLCLISTLHAQEPDSLKAVSLSEVVVTESYQHLKNKNSTWRMEVVGKEFLTICQLVQQLYFSSAYRRMVDTAPCRTDLPVHRCGSPVCGR